MDIREKHEKSAHEIQYCDATFSNYMSLLMDKYKYIILEVMIKK